MMKSRTAIKLMLWLVTVVVIFHFSVLLKIVPYDIAWGGRLKDDAEMYVFEALSIVINLFLILTLLIKGGYVRGMFPLSVTNGILWVFLFLFGLNTIGNLLATTHFEKLFAVLTLAFSILIWIILKEKSNDHPSDAVAP